MCWQTLTDRLRPKNIVCEGARETTAVNGIIGVALRPLAIGRGFHVVILITILTWCNAWTVWMWTTSWTFRTRCSITMGALLWIRGGSALKIWLQTASIWWLSESRDAADESTWRTSFRAKSLQRTATIHYRHTSDAMGKSWWPWRSLWMSWCVQTLVPWTVHTKRDEHDTDCKHCMAGLIVKLLPQTHSLFDVFLLPSSQPDIMIFCWKAACPAAVWQGTSLSTKEIRRKSNCAMPDIWITFGRYPISSSGATEFKQLAFPGTATSCQEFCTWIRKE